MRVAEGDNVSRVDRFLQSETPTLNDKALLDELLSLIGGRHRSTVDHAIEVLVLARRDALRMRHEAAVAAFRNAETVLKVARYDMERLENATEALGFKFVSTGADEVSPVGDVE